ncbi:cysteine hydrolase family protein [Kordiimonas sp.]|uniref:cysteine hydrolase family protein n=1 Tax=Kordiimonas sp. TaxID=1970157 RepID=UPI003A90FDF1
MSTALLIIDVQYAIDHPKWGQRNNAGAEANMAKFLAAWRGQGMPVFHIRHDSREDGSPYAPGQPLHAFKDVVKPVMGERVVGKSTNNAFVGTSLEADLKKAGADKLVITGVLSQHSVDVTARMAASLGFNVTVISDATAAVEVTDERGKHWPADDVHALTLAHLKADYAAIKSTTEVLANLTA